MNGHLKSAWTRKLHAAVAHVEDAVLVVLLSGMLGVAVVQIVMRNFFASGFVWGDMLLRIAVLWVGLTGAMAATRDNSHINIGVITRFLPKRAACAAGCAAEAFAAAVCGFLAVYGAGFVQMEWQDGGMAFAKVPSWACTAIIPITFGVMTLRYLSWALGHLMEAVKKHP